MAGSTHTRPVSTRPGRTSIAEFETADPAMRGVMTITFTLTDADGGTDLVAVHDDLPPGLSSADNETGWRMAFDKLAAFVESGRRE